ncbi:MAG: dipeptidyl-peptidase 3 family protein [Ignavibacteria bacterium]
MKTAYLQETIEKKLAAFKEVQLTSNLSWLSESEKKIIPILIEVAKIMDDLFWLQSFGNKESLLSKIEDPATRQFILINYGPWERLNNNKPFLEGFGEKPKGANFYPVDMTKEEFEKLSDSLKLSPYSILKRDETGRLVVIPYSIAYKEKLQLAASLMKQAAEISENLEMKEYLQLRADALLTDSYQQSDFKWMDMKNSNIDFIVGPIENYEDALFGVKTSFESFVLVKDLEWSLKLQKFTALLPRLQSELPVNPKYKSEIPGTESDMNVYEAIYYAGDCNAGSKTIAINLPNDEEVQTKKGSRRLQLKNAMRAKFDYIMKPIADVLISPEQRKYVKFNAFFENVTFHEVAHGLGIKNTINGKGTVREALKEQYAALEERKADILGLYLVTKLYEMRELDSGELLDNYVTFLAGIFRSCRFGASSAHGKANMMQFYFFEENGAFTRTKEGFYSVNFEKMKEAVEKSIQLILQIQGDGDYEMAKELIKRDGYIKDQLKADLNKVNSSSIPVDIYFRQGVEVLKFNK